MLQSLKGASKNGIVFIPDSKSDLQFFRDSDYVDDHLSGKSKSVMLFLIAGGAIC